MGNSINIRFNYRPLKITHSIVADNGVPARQYYNGDLGEYVPDYTLSPLTLRPIVKVINDDLGAGNHMMPTGVANAKLENVTWRMKVGDGEFTTVQNGSDYVIVTDNTDDKGVLMMYVNAEPGNPITFEFSAVLPDRRQSYVYHQIRETMVVRCVSSTDRPVLELDAKNWTFYNPIDSPQWQTIKARLLVGGEEPDAGLYVLKWELLDAEAGTWHELGSDVMDYYAYLADDGKSVRIDRSAMGYECGVRAWADYDPYGEPSAANIGAGSPRAEAYIRRRMPKLRVDVTHVPNTVRGGQEYIEPHAQVSTAAGVVANPLQHFSIEWKMAAGTASGTGKTFVKVGEGAKAKISLATMAEMYGAEVKAEAVDRGPLKAWVDGDGKILVDNDGKILLI